VLAAFTAVSFAVFASLFPAMTGTAMMASTSRLDNQLLTFNIDGVLLVPARLKPVLRTWGETLCGFHYPRCDGGH